MAGLLDFLGVRPGPAPTAFQTTGNGGIDGPGWPGAGMPAPAAPPPVASFAAPGEAPPYPGLVRAVPAAGERTPYPAWIMPPTSPPVTGPMPGEGSAADPRAIAAVHAAQAAAGPVPIHQGMLGMPAPALGLAALPAGVPGAGMPAPAAADAPRLPTVGPTPTPAALARWGAGGPEGLDKPPVNSMPGIAPGRVEGPHGSADYRASLHPVAPGSAGYWGPNSPLTMSHWGPNSEALAPARTGPVEIVRRGVSDHGAEFLAATGQAPAGGAGGGAGGGGNMTLGEMRILAGMNRPRISPAEAVGYQIGAIHYGNLINSVRQSYTNYQALMQQAGDDAKKQQAARAAFQKEASDAHNIYLKAVGPQQGMGVTEANMFSGGLPPTQ